MWLLATPTVFLKLSNFSVGDLDLHIISRMTKTQVNLEFDRIETENVTRVSVSQKVDFLFFDSLKNNCCHISATIREFFIKLDSFLIL